MTLPSRVLLLFVVFLQLFCVLNADYSVKCVDESYSGTVFKPSEDGVKGRYDVEWCTEGNLNSTTWNLVLSYNLVKKQQNCNKRTQPALKHSEFTVSFHPEDVNCTHVACALDSGSFLPVILRESLEVAYVQQWTDTFIDTYYNLEHEMCFYTKLDMIFSSCFVLENWLPAMGSHRDFFGQYIVNNYTRDSFFDNVINADVFTHEKYVAVHWHLGNVVATTYNMKLCENHKTSDGEQKEENCKLINDNCAVTVSNPHEIVCKLSNLNGSYYMVLEHNAPWTSGGVFRKQVFTHYTFQVSPGRVSLDTANPTSRALWAACAGVLISCAVCAAVLYVWRVRGATRLQHAVLQNWRHRKPGIEPVAIQTDNTVRSVLLLYAREGELGDQLVRAIRDMLQSAGLQVLDLYSAEVVSISAAAPADWLRATLQRSDVTVLLLQTPALAAIYGDRVMPPSADADAALLHRVLRVVPAEPAPGDTLLSLAVRSLSEDVHTHAPYNKYYLATLESLETDTLPYIVPFRRYRLPADSARLLLDMQPTAIPQEDKLDSLKHQTNAFLQHVGENPGYLKDHLLILD